MLLTQNMKIQKWGVLWVALAILVVGGLNVRAQDADSITICTLTPTADSSDPVGIRISWKCSPQSAVAEYFDYFWVLRSENRSFQPVVDSVRVEGRDSCVFKPLDTTKNHFFKVKAYRGDSLLYVTRQGVEWRPWIIDRGPFPISLGYFFLWCLVNIDVLEDGSLDAWHEASNMGEWAFGVIAAFFFVGCFVWLFRTMRTLRSTKVFLVNRRLRGTDNYNECDAVVAQEEFRGLDPDRIACIKSLVKSRLTRSFFRGILGRLERFSIFERSARKRRDPVELRNNPTARILLSAVAALDKPEELETALEVRIMAEEEELRKRSFLDILWALGVTGPLVGLFGTVTGISMSFMNLNKDDPNMLEILSRGIHEALYTTICGLIVGILFMLAYYWYNYKLERIHAIWIVFASDFVDRLKHGIRDAKLIQSEKAEKKES